MRVGNWAVLLVGLSLASCGDPAGGVGQRFEAVGMTTLRVEPDVHTTSPRGTGGELVASLLVDGIVPISIRDLPLVVRGSISGTKVTVEAACIEIDLCDFYNRNELGVAMGAVPSPLVLSAFASTFSGVLTLPISAGDETALATMEAEPVRFNSLTPVEVCPTQYCSEDTLVVKGERLEVGDATFLGEIKVEIDVQSGDDPLGGADAVAEVPGSAPVMSLVDPQLGIDLVDLPLPLQPSAK